MTEFEGQIEKKTIRGKLTSNLITSQTKNSSVDYHRLRIPKAHKSANWTRRSLHREGIVARGARLQLVFAGVVFPLRTPMRTHPPSQPPAPRSGRNEAPTTQTAKQLPNGLQRNFLVATEPRSTSFLD